MSADPSDQREDAYPSRCCSEPRWLKRQDEVVRGGSRAGCAVPTAQLEAYERDGFLVLDDLFSDDELRALGAECRRLQNGVTGISKELVIAEPGNSTPRSIFRVHRISALLRRVAHDSRLVDVAEHILGDRVYVHQSRLNFKPGFVGREFYWHSDFETWHVEDGMPRMRALSVSIGLSDNSEINGPLMLIPGSHRHFIACVGETPEEHFRKSLRKQEYGVPDADSLRRLADDGGIKSVAGPLGTVTLFDCNTMHGSNGNITPYPRSNCFIVYNSVSNALEAPFGPRAPRPEFLAERTDCDPIEALGGSIDRLEAPRAS